MILSMHVCINMTLDMVSGRYRATVRACAHIVQSADVVGEPQDEHATAIFYLPLALL